MGEHQKLTIPYVVFTYAIVLAFAVIEAYWRVAKFVSKFATSMFDEFNKFNIKN